MEPSGSLNLSGQLFNMDQKLALQSGTDGHVDLNTPFFNQARLANFYQNNPFPTLQYSSQFGLPVMGGPINPNAIPGSYALGTSEIKSYNLAVGPATNQGINLTTSKGMTVPTIMASNFYSKQ